MNFTAQVGFAVLMGLLNFAWAGGLPSGAPKSFDLKGLQSKAVFVDITQAHYRIEFDLEKKAAWAESELSFNVGEKGFPVIDLVEDPSSVEVGGEKVQTEVVPDPDGVTKFRILKSEMGPGAYQVRMKHQIKEGVLFENGFVHSAFFMGDLADRNFLELFLPSNLEYDTYAMTMEVKVTGGDAAEDYDLFTNGDSAKSVAKSGEKVWKIVFPPYFNASSPYLHLLPVNARERVDFAWGGKIPVTIYKKTGSSADLVEFRKTLEATLTELEKDYRPFPHPRIVVYAEDDYGGGMEYCGATVTTLWALGHELTHSYFGRGVMPANGNAGWIDEAIASWRDYGYERIEKIPFESAKMGGRSQYIRETDTDAYSLGKQFMSYLDFLLASQSVSKSEESGLKSLLREVLDQRIFKPWVTEEFQKTVEHSLGHSLQKDFDRAIYGKGSETVSEGIRMKSFSPYHPPLTPEIRRKLL